MKNKSIRNCPFCNTECELEGAEYCPECGKPLYNYCTNEYCELNDTDEFGEIFAVPFYSKYCYKCGSKTTLHDYLISDEAESFINS